MEESKVAKTSSEETKEAVKETVEKETEKKESSKKEASKKDSKKDSSKKAKKESKIQGFFKGVVAEFKKIMWPTKDDTIKQTTAVVVVSAISCALIAVLDIAFEYGVDKLIHLFK